MSASEAAAPPLSPAPAEARVAEDALGCPESPDDPRFSSVDRFYYRSTGKSAASTMSPRHCQRLRELVSYFTDERVETVLMPILTMQSAVSLRALDWLVTNYAKKHALAWPLAVGKGDALTTQRMFSVFNEYRTWLRTWRRRLFDPFQRRVRVYFLHEKSWYSTTVGQLNFLYFAQMTQIIEYAHKHVDAIDKDMTLSIHASRKRKIDEGSSERRELSRAPKTACYVYAQPCRLVFDSEEEEEEREGEENAAKEDVKEAVKEDAATVGRGGQK